MEKPTSPPPTGMAISKSLSGSTVEWLSKTLDALQNIAVEKRRARRSMSTPAQTAREPASGQRSALSSVTSRNVRNESSELVPVSKGSKDEMNSTDAPKSVDPVSHSQMEQMFAVAGVGPSFFVPAQFLESRKVLFVDPVRFEERFMRSPRYFPNETGIRTIPRPEERANMLKRYRRALQLVESNCVDIPCARFLDSEEVALAISEQKARKRLRSRYAFQGTSNHLEEDITEDTPLVKFIEGSERYAAMRDSSFPAIPMLVPNQEFHRFEALFLSTLSPLPEIHVRRCHEKIRDEMLTPWREGNFSPKLPGYLQKRKGISDGSNIPSCSTQTLPLLSKKSKSDPDFEKDLFPSAVEADEVIHLLRFSYDTSALERGWYLLFADTLKLEKSFRLDLRRYISRHAQLVRRRKSVSEYQEFWKKLRRKKIRIREKAREAMSSDGSRGHAKSIHLPVPYVRLDGPYPNELSEYATVDLPNVNVLENEEQPTVTEKRATFVKIEETVDPFLFREYDDVDWVSSMRMLKENCILALRSAEIPLEDEVLFVRFLHGGHVFAVLRDLGLECIPILVPEEQLEEFFHSYSADITVTKPHVDGRNQNTTSGPLPSSSTKNQSSSKSVDPFRVKSR